MMTNQTTATLETIVSEILQNLAFMFSDDELPEVLSEDDWVETSICYRGPKEGKLFLHCPRGFTVLLVANLLGMDPDDPDVEDHAEDAVKEFMNICCGQLVTELHGTHDIYDLTIPVVQALEEIPDFSEAMYPVSYRTSVQGYPLQMVYEALEN